MSLTKQPTLIATANGKKTVFPIIHRYHTPGSLMFDEFTKYFVNAYADHKITAPECLKSYDKTKCATLPNFIPNLVSCWSSNEDNVSDVATRMAISLCYSKSFCTHDTIPMIDKDASPDNSIVLRMYIGDGNPVYNNDNSYHNIALITRSDPQQIIDRTRDILYLFQAGVIAPTYELTSRSKIGELNDLSDEDYARVVAYAKRKQGDIAIHANMSESQYRISILDVIATMGRGLLFADCVPDALTKHIDAILNDGKWDEMTVNKRLMR
jgi:hypothetical protein